MNPGTTTPPVTGLFIHRTHRFDCAVGFAGPDLVLSFVPAAGIWIDIFFRGKHLVLGGNQYKVIRCKLRCEQTT